MYVAGVYNYSGIGGRHNYDLNLLLCTCSVYVHVGKPARMSFQEGCAGVSQ